MWHRNMRSSLRRRTNKKRPGKGVAHKPGRFPPLASQARASHAHERDLPIRGLLLPSKAGGGSRTQVSNTEQYRQWLPLKRAPSPYPNPLHTGDP